MGAFCCIPSQLPVILSSNRQKFFYSYQGSRMYAETGKRKRETTDNKSAGLSQTEGEERGKNKKQRGDKQAHPTSSGLQVIAPSFRCTEETGRMVACAYLCT